MSEKYINTIKAESMPVYGYYGFGWISSYWDQMDWIAWHTAFFNTYGIEAANQRFILAWNDSPFLAANISFRASWIPGNERFIEYAKANNFYDALFSGILGVVGQIESTAYDALKDTTTVVGKVTTSLKSVSSYILPVAIIGLGLYLFLHLKKLKLI